jgi:hypothetical protein
MCVCWKLWGRFDVLVRRAIGQIWLMGMQGGAGYRVLGTRKGGACIPGLRAFVCVHILNTCRGNYFLFVCMYVCMSVYVSEYVHGVEIYFTARRIFLEYVRWYCLRICLCMYVRVCPHAHNL